MFLDGTLREVSSTDLLSDTTSLAGLHIGPSQLVEDECFACVDVTENTEDGTAELEVADLLGLLGLGDLCLSGLLPSLAFLSHLESLLFGLMAL